MFKAPFSFGGRIRRLEYGLSYLLYIFLHVLTVFVWQEWQKGATLFFMFYVVLLWFFLAQGAKRAHDLGNSGFYQFIPFYGFWLVFQEGDQNENKYGLNPKEDTLKTKTILKERDTTLITLIESSSAVLLNTLLIGISLEYLYTSEVALLFLMTGSSILCYFLMLLLNYKGFKLKTSRKVRFKQRVVYSTALYICIRLYTLYFRNSELDLTTVYLEVFLIALFLGSTHISLAGYNLLFKKNQFYEY